MQFRHIFLKYISITRKKKQEKDGLKKFWRYNLKNTRFQYTRQVNGNISPFIPIVLFMLPKALIIIAKKEGVKFFINYNF